MFTAHPSTPTQRRAPEAQSPEFIHSVASTPPACARSAHAPFWVVARCGVSRKRGGAPAQENGDTSHTWQLASNFSPPSRWTEHGGTRPVPRRVLRVQIHPPSHPYTHAGQPSWGLALTRARSNHASAKSSRELASDACVRGSMPLGALRRGSVRPRRRERFIGEREEAGIHCPRANDPPATNPRVISGGWAISARGRENTMAATPWVFS